LDVGRLPSATTTSAHDRGLRLEEKKHLATEDTKRPAFRLTIPATDRRSQAEKIGLKNNPKYPLIEEDLVWRPETTAERQGHPGAASPLLATTAGQRCRSSWIFGAPPSLLLATSAGQEEQRSSTPKR
jgi:hypothetical protein